MCIYIDTEEHEFRDLGEPANYKAALLDPESDKWLSAMNVEIQSMKDNKVWDLVDLPPNDKIVGSKWLFKKKIYFDRVVHTYKARFVAKGYTQTPGIDYEETFSPVADIRAISGSSHFPNLCMCDGHLDHGKQHSNVTRCKILPLEMFCDERFRSAEFLATLMLGYLLDQMTSIQTGYVFVLNGGVVDWKSVKQSIFATSSAKAEYIAAYDASKEVVWVKKFISGLGVVPIIEEPINMYCDNTRAITIANESAITKGARHFRAKFHYLREVIEYGDVKLEKVHTYDNLADPFTKALAFPKHSEHTKNIGMLPASSLM
ncbi:putative retrotransposon protein [Tanacetum coccineum]